MPEIGIPSYLQMWSFRTFLLRNGERVPLHVERIAWEGLHLVVTRSARKDDDSRLAGIFVGEVVDLVVQAVDRQGEPVRTWTISYRQVIDRGFEAVDAGKDGALREMCLLVNPKVTELR